MSRKKQSQKTYPSRAWLQCDPTCPRTWGVVVWTALWAEPAAWWDGEAAAGGCSSPRCAGQDEAKPCGVGTWGSCWQEEKGCLLPTVALGLTPRQPYNPPAGCRAAVAVCGLAAACVPCPRRTGPLDGHSWGASLVAPLPWKCWFGTCLQSVYGLPISTWVLYSLQCVAELSGREKCPVSSPLHCQYLGSLRHPTSLGHVAGEEGPTLGFLCKSLSSRGTAAGDKMARWHCCQGHLWDGEVQPTIALVKTLRPSFPFLDITGHIPSLSLQGPAKEVALCPQWHEKTSCCVQAALVFPKPSSPSIVLQPKNYCRL